MAGTVALRDGRPEARVGKRVRVGIVSYKRQSDDADADEDSGDVDEAARGRAFLRFVGENEPLLDAILYDWFPDKLPGELDDSLDLLRFWRMIETKSIMAVEDFRKRFYAGKEKEPAKGDREAKAEWARKIAAIKRHDDWLKDAGLWED